MEKDNLREILNQHKIWLETSEKERSQEDFKFWLMKSLDIKPPYLSDTNLVGADLLSK